MIAPPPARIPDQQTLARQARRLLDAYLAARLPLLSQTDLDTLEVQRQAFLTRFGPQALAALADDDLPGRLPLNPDSHQPLDYWLEFKTDAVFDTRRFGGLKGGSAAKFGVWRDQQGQWRERVPGGRGTRTVSPTQALAVLVCRRREILAAAEALAPFAGLPPDRLDPVALQRALEVAAPRWGTSAWLHKYLHLLQPRLVSWWATLARLRAGLYRLGEPAGSGGLYALDSRICQVWATLPALAELDPWQRYRLGEGLTPRPHWCLRLTGEGARMVAEGWLGLGPDGVEGLAGVYSLSRHRERRAGVGAALEAAGLGMDPRLCHDLLALGEVSGVMALVDGDSGAVVAVGEVAGGYRHQPGEGRPHRLPVRWPWSGAFAPAMTPDFGPGDLVALEGDHPLVAGLEAALLGAGQGPWPGFEAFRESRLHGDAPARSLAPAPGLVGEVLTILERKPQVILYGPPGTGKTWQAERVALELVARHNFHRPADELDALQRQAVFGRDGAPPYIITCTFHPTVGYEDFIEGYRPLPGGGFSLSRGLFLERVQAARDHPQRAFVLIIDEINRGQLARIFGELLTLLEPARRGREAVVLPLSGERLTVPPNLYLIGTMNTADRSILLLDTALRRRFAFRELLPEPQRLAGVALAGLDLGRWLTALNRRIRQLLGPDGRNLQVGHGYFMEDGRPVTDPRRLVAILAEDIWPLLQEYCYQDPNWLEELLGGLYDPRDFDLRRELLTPGREGELAATLGEILERSP